MRQGDTAKSIAMIVLVGIMPVVGLNLYLQKNVTAWDRQGIQARGRPFTVDLASDGCFWRTYMTEGERRTERRVDILPDDAGGHENCPYRK